MNCCGLSSTGLNDIDANNITSDNITIFSNLNVSGTTNLNNTLNVQGIDILSSINNLNNIINNDSSAVNINSSNIINFNVNNTQLTKIDTTGLSVYHPALETFPYNYEGWYNIGDRFNKLYHVMSDTPNSIINYDATHNTVIRIGEQDIVNQIYYPRQIQFQTYQGTSISKFDVQGLQLLDKYNNWYYINKLFSITNNSTLLCSDKVMVDSSGDLKVYVPATNTWLDVSDNLFSNNTQSITEQINTATNSIIGAVGALATLGSYYQSLQLTAAVVAGVVVGSGLLLAFTLKEDKFDAKLPLTKRAPVTSNSEYYTQLELNYNETLLLDVNNKLTVNTTGFLCPYYGDLSLASTPYNITSSSSTYVVVTQISQPVTCLSSLNVSGNSNFFNKATCHSSLNVSGYSSFLNDVTCMSNLSINGALKCDNQIIGNNATYLSSLNVSGLTTLSNNVTLLSALNISGFTTLNSNVTIVSSLNVSGLTTLSNNTTINGILNVSGNSNFNNIVTLNSSLNVSGLTTLSNNTTINGILNVNGKSQLVNDTTIISSLNVSGRTTLSNNVTLLSALNISGFTTLNNNVTIVSSLNISGLTTLSNNTTIIGTLHISGNTVLNNIVSLNSSLNISGASIVNNLLTCSSLNVSGISNIGPLFINNFTGTRNTFFQIGTTGNILSIQNSQYSTLGCSENPNDTHMIMYSGGGSYYRVNYNTSGNTLHLFGDTNITSNNYLKLEPNMNTSYNPFIIQGNTTMNSNLNILGKIYASNLPNVSTFNIVITQLVSLNSSLYYKYDLDLRQYTISNTTFPFISIRKFKFMCSLASGAHNAGSYTLNYDIDYSDINYPSTGPQASLAQYNGINVIACGFPYTNTNLNQITSNGLFILKNTFDYISIFSKNQVNLNCIIIDYLK